MDDRIDLRRAAQDIFDDALKSVDAGQAVRKAVELDGTRINTLETSFDLATRARGRINVYAIAIGKAAYMMATALDAVLGDHIAAGIVVGPRQRLSPSSFFNAPNRDTSFRTRWRTFEGGHPLPNRASLLAASNSFELMERAEAERALVIFLISGGGSAMIEWPTDDSITLRDLRAANRLLVSCGATIAEINAVRRSFSAVKGGGLGARAPHAAQLSLIISDTGAGDESNVASGPTLEPPVGGSDIQQILSRYELTSRFPQSILRTIEQPHTSSKALASRKSAGGGGAGRPVRAHYVLLDNRHVVAAAAHAAKARGFIVETANDIVEQHVAEGSSLLLERLLALHRHHCTRRKRVFVCLVAGGEFVCPVRGRGMGGRNSETVLRCALEMNERIHAAGAKASLPKQVTVLSAGTDGIDGNSPAAGAIADQETIRRGRALGLDAQAFLDASDAYSFFNALNDAVLTGPTGTNVRDLRLLFAG